MDAQEKGIEALKRLVAEGRKVVEEHGWNGQSFVSDVPYDRFAAFQTRALNLVRRICGDVSEHYKALVRLAERNTATNPHYMPHWLGVVEASLSDVQEGLMFDMRSLIEADILGDFLQQAEKLLSTKYTQASASLGGAVLEDSLRKISSRNGISLPERTSINLLNSGLAAAGVYNKLKQKQITAWAELRNNADHGRWDQVTPEDVAAMLKGIRDFTADHLR